MKVGDLIGHAFDKRIKGIVMDFYPNGMVSVFWTGSINFIKLRIAT